MQSRLRARRGGLRTAALVACAVTTGTAYAAGTPGAQDAGTSAVTLAGAGDHQKVRYGRRIAVRGATREPRRPVRLEHAPAGQGWRPVAETTAGDGGSYSFVVRARRSGAYRAVSDAGGSASRRVTVVARLLGRATRHVRRGSRVRVRGRLRPGLSGERVALQRRTARGWRTVDRARTRRGGRFRAAWWPASQGGYRLRVRFGGDRAAAASSRTLRGRVRVYRPSYASWYGPGFYGNRTACGRTLGYDTLGVAHRTLPCGTRVTFRLRGRSVTVPVIDRGPYGGGREWDLTGATKRRLGFGSTGTVWTTR